MDTGTAPMQMATHALQAIPFSSIISGPLTACIEAQAMAAKTTWDFIQEVGLNTNPETGEKTAVNVSFSFMQGGRMMQVNVPLLTIVPIPYIAINSVDINFKASISASSSVVAEQNESTTEGGELSASGGMKLGLFHVDAKFNANYSSKKDSRATAESKYSVEYTMDVAIKAGQDSMPAGLAKVLEVLGGSLDVSDPKGVLHVNSMKLQSAEDEEGGMTAQLIAIYKDGNGMLVPEKIHVATVEGEEVTVTPDDLIESNLVVKLPIGSYIVSVGTKGEPMYKAINVEVL